MSSPSQSKQKSPQTTADASQTKAEVESDHSQQQQSISSNRYGDLTNLLHAAAALSELPNHDVDMKGGKKEVSGVSVPVSDDDAKTVPTITITTNTTTNTTNTTAQDKVVEKHVNPPPSYYPPPIYHTNGPIYVHDRNQMQMMHPPQQMQAIEFEQDGKTKRPYTNTRHTFPLKLMEILNSKTDFSDIIRWSRNGTSFQIIDPMKLCETVLPLYFPGEKVKYPSFTRKLNRWGFRQISRGPDGGAFFHEWFLRDKPEICKDMVCKPSIRKGSYIKSFGTSMTSTRPMMDSVQGHMIHHNNGYGYHLHQPMFQQVARPNQIQFRNLPLHSNARISMPSLPVPSHAEPNMEKVTTSHLADKSS